MSESQLVVRPKASQQLAQLIGMDPAAMLDTIKAQCFKTNPANVTNEQLAAFVSIAAEMQVNPLLPGMLYAYPIQGGGIIPIMGPDGVYKKLSERDDIVSWETEVFPVDVALPPTHAVTKIWRKDRDKPLSYTAVFSEWKINTNPNWNSRPRHMLALRSLKHAARQIIHGLPGDEDDRHIMSEINVTPGAGATEDPQTKRSDPPARARKEKGANAAQDPKTIDVETVPPKTDQPASPPPAPADKPAPAAETPPPAPPPPAPPKQEEKVVEKSNAPRDSLKADEEITAKVVIEKIFALIIAVAGVPTPSVQATVKGDFVGPVFHFGGSSKKPGSEELVAAPEWKVGETVNLVLWGRINTKTQKVMPVVKSITSGGSADTPVDVG